MKNLLLETTLLSEYIVIRIHSYRNTLLLEYAVIGMRCYWNTLSLEYTDDEDTDDEDTNNEDTNNEDIVKIFSQMHYIKSDIYVNVVIIMN